MRAPSPRRSTVVAVCLLAVGGALAGCGGDDGSATAPSISATLLSAPPAGLVSSTTSSTGPAPSPVGGVTSTTGTDSGTAVTTLVPSSSTTSSLPGRTATSTTSTPATSSTTTTTTTPPPTGLPGGASDDPVCRDYATVVGSQAVLLIAGAFGDLDPGGLARLELIASPAIVAAADRLEEEWPSALAGEREVVMGSVIGPIAERAGRAAAAVDAAGIDDAALTAAWRATLDSYDPSRANVAITSLSPAVETDLVPAATAYAADAVRYDRDDSLLRGAATPQTTTYLFDRCPELSYLIAGDGD